MSITEGSEDNIINNNQTTPLLQPSDKMKIPSSYGQQPSRPKGKLYVGITVIVVIIVAGAYLFLSPQTLQNQSKNIYATESQAKSLFGSITQSYYINIYNKISNPNVTAVLTNYYLSNNNTINDEFASQISDYWGISYVGYKFNHSVTVSLSENIYNSSDPKNTYHMLLKYGGPDTNYKFNVTNATEDGVVYSYAGNQIFTGYSISTYMVAYKGNYVYQIETQEQGSLSPNVLIGLIDNKLPSN